MNRTFKVLFLLCVCIFTSFCACRDNKTDILNTAHKIQEAADMNLFFAQLSETADEMLPKELSPYPCYDYVRVKNYNKISQIKEYVLSVYSERVAEKYFFNLFEDEDAPYMIETDNGLYVWPYFDYGGVRATYDVNSIEIIQSNGKSATFKISFYYDDLSDIQDCEIRLVKENNKWVFDQLPYYDDLK